MQDEDRVLLIRRTQDESGPHGHIHLENNSEDTIEKLRWRQAQISGELAALKADSSEALSWEIIRISRRTASVPEIWACLHLSFSWYPEMFSRCMWPWGPDSSCVLLFN